MSSILLPAYSVLDVSLERPCDCMASQWQPPEQPSHHQHTAGVEDDLLGGSGLKRAIVLVWWQ